MKALLLIGMAGGAFAALPAPPFAGPYGGTAGAGSVAGWDRLSAGANPAALGRVGLSVSLAGYAPFGLDGLRTLEAGVARDAPDWGASVTYQNRTDAGRLLAAEAEARTAMRFGGAAGGVALGWRRTGEGRERSHAFATGMGVLWRPPAPARVLGLGAQVRAAEGEPPLAAFGADLSARLPGAFAGARAGLSAEAHFTEGAREERYGATLRLHALLAIHAGWAPGRRTAALGVRFGAGAWEGFSAVRRHAALGGTSIQGLRWRRAPARDEDKGEGP